jgi:transposase
MQIRGVLTLLFPEFTQVFTNPCRPTARALLHRYPSAPACVDAGVDGVLATLRALKSRRYGRATAQQLVELAAQSAASGVARAARERSLGILCDQLAHTQEHLAALEAEMTSLVQNRARFWEIAALMVDWDMRPPIYVRPLTEAEFAALERGMHSSDSFTLRRCQILLASARAERAPDIARALSCGDQTVRNAIHEFNEQGLASLQRESSRPKTVVPLFDRPRAEQLRALLHRSPRDFGHATSVWTLELAAQTCAAERITPYQVSIETLRQALRQLGLTWRRAKHWITSPDPEYAKKNSAATA